MNATDEKKATANIAATLYAAGRPLSIEDIIHASGTKSRKLTLKLLEALMKKVKGAFTSIEIVRLPDGSYVFQLKPEYNPIVRRYASKPLLSNAILKTLSYIAHKQPILSSELVEVRGTGVYSHLRELRQLDYIAYQNIGRRKSYSTTKKFQEYFGIKGDHNAIREMLFAKIRRTAQGT